MRNQWCFNNVEVSAVEVVDKVIREWNEVPLKGAEEDDFEMSARGNTDST